MVSQCILRYCSVYFCKRAVQKIAPAAEIEEEKLPYSVCLVQSGGLFNGKEKKQKKRWQHVIIFRGGKRSTSHRQNENASSGLKLYLCHGFRWPNVDDAFKDWKENISIAEVLFCGPWQCNLLTNCLQRMWPRLLKGKEINTSKHN